MYSSGSIYCWLHNHYTRDLRAYFSVIFTVAYARFACNTGNSSFKGRTDVIYSIREYEALRPYLRDWLRRWAAKYLIPDIISTIPYGLIFGLHSPHFVFCD
ncbi:hypothetical protein BCR33DRAFT_326393 [Rhizoclosmatium globosum]|uniref:Uncharacterized protein n=1 Tax=Rhizoclosmatium globosum TaxID=329046 RepID=A0A1Y2C4I4_9FUNG|nr:hypothetical protein BCR33DRAFT_326393 [Rhizoclosmatium globosum]|eukprot:ORY41856.1 hypothetical protein BCR33DRAFT_326393 [Rhizoclosmatium globosum]